MAKGSKHAQQRFRKWINSYADVSSWIEKHGDLEQLVEENGGLVKIENFLPTFVAEGILKMLQGIDERTWNLTAAGDDYVHNNIRHEFLSVKQGPPGLQEVFRIFTLLLPDSLFTFSAAKYCKAGHIAPHDDRAYTQHIVKMEDGSMQLCSRSVACIYYLTQGWVEADGGQLVDLEAPGGPQQHLPAFNSVVAFRIPRWHEVKPVTGDRPRYSIFGWFLEPGKLYELNTGAEAPQQDEGVPTQDTYQGEEEEQQQQQQQRQQHAVPVVKQKSKKVKQQLLQAAEPAKQQQQHLGKQGSKKQKVLPPLKREQQQQQQQHKKKQRQLNQPVLTDTSGMQAAQLKKKQRQQLQLQSAGIAQQQAKQLKKQLQE